LAVVCAASREAPIDKTQERTAVAVIVSRILLNLQ
jgi:hypothetical protein